MSRRRYAPPTILNVGAGIPDGPGWSVPWTRQGCRVLRNSYAFAPVRRSTTPGTARRHTQVPPYEWDGSLFGVRGKRESRRPPPRQRVADGGFGAVGNGPGDCAICGWRYGRLGISPAAAGGCFAGCGQREFRPVRGATKGSAFGNRDFLKKIE